MKLLTPFVASPWMPLEAGHEVWLQSTRLMDLSDSKLRFRVQSLVQLRHAPRDRAIALYGFVKTLPLTMPMSYAIATANDVLNARGAGWYGKSMLLVAMMRAAGLPARLRMLGMSGELLRGLANTHLPFYLPVVEVYLDGRWVRTDTHIHDPALMRAARNALTHKGWMRGYGVHRLGDSLWNGRDDAFAAMALDRHHSGMPVHDYGVYSDMAEFIAHMRETQPHQWAMGMAHYRILRPRLRLGLKRLAREATGGYWRTA